MKIIYWIKEKKWYRYPWKSCGKCRVGYNYHVMNPNRISIGNFFYFEENLRIQAWTSYKTQTFAPSIIIGNHVSMMENCQISCCNKITIGDGCLFGANVFITDNYHGDNSASQLTTPPNDRPLNVKGEVNIGENVWIGRNLCIMPGVTIGNGAVVGANAVVTHDIPNNCVAVGAPAKVIKKIEE